MSKYYHFESADVICDYYNKFANALKKEKESTKIRYHWLDKDDERKHMTDIEILDRCIDLDKSCFTDTERKEVRDMLYKYKDTFSLRDEIGTCSKIEMEIYITDWRPFFIRPYHAEEEDKTILDKEMKRLCYLGVLKEGFLAYTSPVMLISRKMTQDKRTMTDFKHLNMRIGKNNLAYPF